MSLKNIIRPISALLCCLVCLRSFALDRPEKTFSIFQFPADKIPRIDGNIDDWAMVPESYVIGSNELIDDTHKHPGGDSKTLNVRVRVGWVKGLNRLYFLYEADDDYWDFSRPDLHNDTFEIVVDGDASGGPLIDKGHKEFWTPDRVGVNAASPDERITTDEAHWAVHGVHAQNYHIFTPPGDKDWCLAWGAPTWIKQFPYANASYRYDFKPGQPGHLILEFWITPFDYAGPEGPQRAVESVLRENKIIGLSWAIIDYDDATKNGNNGFWTLSRKHTMYGNAAELCAFRLMPLEADQKKTIDAQWGYSVVDMDRRLVAFKDLSEGKITSWKWDFGDGNTSTDQYPLHQYEKPGSYVVILDIEGPEGKSRRSKVWDVQLR